jgi:hypothetical protein
VRIGFAMIFGLRSTALHVIDHPFSGDVAVGPAPLERVLADFGR